MTNSSINTTNPIGINSGGTNTNSMPTTYGVIYYDGTRLNETGAGMSAQVLRSNGPSSAPSFEAAPTGSGGWTLIQTVTASSSQPQITGFSGYLSYVVLYSSVFTVTSSGSDLQFQLSQDAGSTWFAPGGNAGWMTIIPANSGASLIGAQRSAFSPGESILNNSAFNAPASGILWLYNIAPNSTTVGASFWGEGAYTRQSLGGFSICKLQTSLAAFGANINGIKFNAYGGASNNIVSGTFSLYGISQ
jgi:hypothetical protein